MHPAEGKGFFRGLHLLKAGYDYGESMPNTETSIQVNFCLDVDAVEILNRCVPQGPHKKGRFLSRLLYEHAVRLEERERLRARPEGGLTGEHQPAT
jgi:hypothetical protein